MRPVSKSHVCVWQTAKFIKGMMLMTYLQQYASRNRIHTASAKPITNEDGNGGVSGGTGANQSTVTDGQESGDALAGDAAGLRI